MKHNTIYHNTLASVRALPRTNAHQHTHTHTHTHVRAGTHKHTHMCARTQVIVLLAKG